MYDSQSRLERIAIKKGSRGVQRRTLAAVKGCLNSGCHDPNPESAKPDDRRELSNLTSVTQTEGIDLTK